MTIKSLLVIIIIGLTPNQSKPEKGWCGIIPLVTTQTEVEKLLGKPILGEQGYVLTYDTQDERVTIWYGGVKPSTITPCKWNVPSDTVISFTVAPKIRKPLSEAKLDLTKYTRVVSLELRDYTYYTSEDKRIMIETRLEDGVEKILTYDFQPTPDEVKAKCIPKTVVPN